MGTYLDKFRSSVPSIQGKQILDILQQKKNLGSIQTVQELKQELTDLTQDLLNQHIVPTLKLFLGSAGKVIDSDTYNFMLNRIQDDLTTGFTEVNTIQEVIDLHQFIINDVTLKAIQFAINELDEHLTLYSLLDQDPHGFQAGEHNTFSNENGTSTSRSSSIAGTLFGSIESDAIVDDVSDQLILGSSSIADCILQEAQQIFDGTTDASEIDVSFPNSDIANIIDEKDGTYWIYNTMLSKPKTSGILQKISITLAGVQDINFIQLDPACPHPMTVESITYTSNNNSQVSLPISDIIIDKPTKFLVPRFTASQVIVSIRQANYIETQFQESPVDTSFYNVVTKDLTPGINLPAISDSLRNIFTSDYLLEDVLGIPRDPQVLTQHKYFQYLVGFDNIKLGLINYDETSIWASGGLNVDNPGLIGLKTVETRPANGTDLTTGDSVYLGSIEYQVVKENFDTNGTILGIDKFNVLPDSLTRIIGERLDLEAQANTTVVNNVGFTRFYPVPTTTIYVYRNGTLLTQGNGTPGTGDWNLVSSLGQTSFRSNVPMRLAIQINNPKPLDIYTVTYTPLISNTRELPPIGFTASLISISSLGNGGNIRLVPGNLVTTEVNLPASTIVKSTLYLIITLRRNSPDEHQTPAVRSYTFLAGSEDESKFVSDFS